MGAAPAPLGRPRFLVNSSHAQIMVNMINATGQVSDSYYQRGSLLVRGSPSHAFWLSAVPLPLCSCAHV
jgi:hypothetical protein